MGKLVMIDTQIFVWGIKGVATEGQEHRIEPAKRFIKYLEDEKSKLLLPVPQMAELLAYVPPAEQAAIKQLFDRRFQVRPFDVLAAEKCAELLYRSFNDRELIAYRAAHSVPKQKIKYDCMLVAMAITNRVSKIYSDDRDLKKYAGGQIDVEGMPEIAPSAEQSTIDFKQDVNILRRLAAPDEGSVTQHNDGEVVALEQIPVRILSTGLTIPGSPASPSLG